MLFCDHTFLKTTNYKNKAVTPAWFKKKNNHFYKLT